ncbi:hypothetical protein KP509_06G005600 [Ceratopteris richardii]|uniref:CCHC-type domain-containing protein n=1 Tax=Ceratopteris richardii TaxID=49495 RepID=A0A8T2UFF7_CERRI|nr:hypothetical protein KP509_06G005600 [Ceratopteris richardii]
MDYLRQGVNESIDNYIQRMETLVRKMGANAPNDETLKRRFIAGLRDPTAQQHISLTRLATSIDAKEQARLWEEVQLCQQRKMELLYEPMGGPGNTPMKDPGQGSPTLTTPAFVAATSTPDEVKPALIEERILELVTQALKAVTMTQETYTVKPEVTTNPNQVFRSNTWCGNCHGYSHLASECPTVSRVFIDRSPPRMRCTFCGRTNHTEDRCYNKKTYEERTMKSGDTRERSYTGLPPQSVPPTSRWENRQTYEYGAQGQGGDYPRGVAHDQRRDGPIQCWRCHGFGHTQSRCPNEKKPVDYTPLCRYCSGEGHFDEDYPKRRASTGKDKGPVGSSNYVETQMHSTPRAQEHVPTIGVVFKTLNPQEGSSSSMHFLDAYQAKKPHKEPTVAVVTRSQEYLKKNPEGGSEKRARRRHPNMESITTQIYSNAPAVTVEIKGYAVPGSQLDSGAAVNLMIEYMMKALGLNHMEETPMSLRMADQTQVKPAGLLKNVSTVVGSLEFKVDYLIVRPRTSEATFSILLGRPWLMQANCVHDWHTGFISIGPKRFRSRIARMVGRHRRG